jgi:hypothetical protein
MKTYTDYLRYIAAEQVHLRGAQDFCDLTTDYQEGLVEGFKKFFSRILKKEHGKQHYAVPESKLQDFEEICKKECTL